MSAENIEGGYLPLKMWRADKPEIQERVRKVLAFENESQYMLEIQTLGGIGLDETHSALAWMIERGEVEKIPDPSYGPAYPRFQLANP